MGSLERRETLVQLLRRRGDWTIDDLAYELGVSRRTILRDVNHLRERGFEISGMSGPGVCPDARAAFGGESNGTGSGRSQTQASRRQ
jgi:predicted DNA-binding transcriptional regulator YafY